MKSWYKNIFEIECLLTILATASVINGTYLRAKKMIENGLLDSITPDEIYTLHVTALPVEKIIVKSNELFAYQKEIQIALKNR